ncbi:MAG TPA: hypothetical protein VIV10_00630 [Gemmatimonadales bacterium]
MKFGSRLPLALAGSLLLVGALPARGPAQDCSGTTFFLSAAVVTGLAVWDIASTPRSVRRYNERHVTVEPAVNLREHRYGVTVAVPLGRRRAPPVAERRTAAGPKSAATGVLLGVGATGVPIGTGLLMGADAGAWVFLSGVVVGPSVGQFYAGQTARAAGTIALRAAGSAVGISSLVGCFSD